MKTRKLNFDLKQLRSFLEILNEHSFTRASRNLKVGQATISHQIQNLEESLGVTLVRRTSKEFSITKEGMIFRNFCLKVFEELDILKDKLNEKFTGGITTIASSTIPSTYIIPKIISSLHKEYPDFVYRIDTADSREAVEKLKEGRAEIGVVGNMIKHPLLSYKIIYKDSIVLVGTKNSPNRISIDELRDMPFITRGRGSGTRHAIELSLKRHNIHHSDLSVIFECSTSEGIKEATAAGIGVSFISKLAIKRELDIGILKIIDVDGLNIERNFYTVQHANRHLSHPADVFLEKISAAFR